jgi:AraC-like DNA-binding protein
MISIRDHVNFALYHIERASYKQLDLIEITKDYWTISFVIKGDLTTQTCRYKLEVKSGEVMIHPPKIPFTEISRGEGTHIYMLFDLKLSPGIDFFSLLPVSQVITILHPDSFKAALETLLAISEEPESPLRKLKAMSLSFGILGDIYESWVAAGSNARPEEIMSDVNRFAHILSYMEKNLHQKLTREELSKKMHLHPSYFNRAFKSVHRMSCMQMLRDMRLRRAMQLLEDTDETLESISRQCGLAEAAYFSRVFRQVTGKTPGDYRKSIKNTKAGYISAFTGNPGTV